MHKYFTNISYSSIPGKFSLHSGATPCKSAIEIYTVHYLSRFKKPEKNLAAKLHCALTSKAHVILFTVIIIPSRMG